MSFYFSLLQPHFSVRLHSWNANWNCTKIPSEWPIDMRRLSFLRRLASWFLQPRFNPKWGHVRFVADKVTQGHAFSTPYKNNIYMNINYRLGCENVSCCPFAYVCTPFKRLNQLLHFFLTHVAVATRRTSLYKCSLRMLSSRVALPLYLSFFLVFLLTHTPSVIGRHVVLKPRRNYGEWSVDRRGCCLRCEHALPFRA
jgi:hypothetical protein